MTQFKIIAFGPPESGKTVYLSALQRIICDRSIGDGISFAIKDSRQREFLDEVYGEATDPTVEKWPDSTNPYQPPREFDFQCTVEWTGMARLSRTRTVLHSFDVFKLTYIDYAGEWITESKRTVDDIHDYFTQLIKDADAVLGIIDGVELKKYLYGDGGGQNFFDSKLRPVVRMMREHPGKPMHFVITKSDVLDIHSLERFADVLLLSPGTGFQELVRSRTARRRRGRSGVGEIRLIPVSSVGSFARLVRLGTEWKVEKAIGEVPFQVNVEIPIIAALLDACDRKLEDLLRTAISSKSQPRTSKNRWQMPDDALQAQYANGETTTTANLFAIIGFTLDVGIEAAKQMGGPALRLARRANIAYRRIKARDLEGVLNEDDALVYVARSFRTRLLEFEKDPANRGSRLIPSVQVSDIGTS